MHVVHRERGEREPKKKRSFHHLKCAQIHPTSFIKKERYIKKKRILCGMYLSKKEVCLCLRVVAEAVDWPPTRLSECTF